MLSYFPNRVFRSCPAIADIARVLALRWRAILAFLDIGTGKMQWIFGKIILAAFFRDTVSFCKGIYTGSNAAIATSSSLAINHNLRRKRNIWPSAIASDVDSISNGTSTALGPATPTISRNMLILGPGKIVHS